MILLDMESLRRKLDFYRAMLCISEAYAVMRCPSVRLSVTNNKILCSTFCIIEANY